MSDLLSAQSLLLAAITALLALWNDDLDRAANHAKPTSSNYRDYEKLHKAIKRTLWLRALPLFLYAAALSLILIPASWGILVGVQRAVMGTSRNVMFDAVAATLILVHVGMILLAIHLAGVVKDIWEKHGAFARLKPRA